MPVGIICSHFVPFGRESPLDLIFQPLLKIRGGVFSSVTASWLKLSHCWNCREEERRAGLGHLFCSLPGFCGTAWE